MMTGILRRALHRSGYTEPSGRADPPWARSLRALIVPPSAEPPRISRCDGNHNPALLQAAFRLAYLFDTVHVRTGPRPPIVCAEAEEARRWLRHHQNTVVIVDKSLGYCVARSLDIATWTRRAFSAAPFEPAPRSEADDAWSSLRRSASRLLRSLDQGFLADRVLRLAPYYPKPVPCLKLHKPKPALRPVLGCASKGVNVFTTLALHVFRDALCSPFSVKDLASAATVLRSCHMRTPRAGDAASMFLNVPRARILSALRMMCPGVPPGAFEFANDLLAMSYFELDGLVMRQTTGVFIGLGAAPLLACAPYVAAERLAPRSLLLFRYLDDVIIDGPSPYGDLPMTFDESTDPILYAGLQVHRCGLVVPKLREQRRWKWVHRNIAIPESVKLAVASGLFYSFLRLSSVPREYEPALGQVAQLLRLHGYETSFIRCARRLAFRRWREPRPEARPHDPGPVRYPHAPAGGRYLHYLIRGVVYALKRSFDASTVIQTELGAAFRAV